MRTPWGESDNLVQVAPGIQWVTTPGFTGYVPLYLAPTETA